MTFRTFIASSFVAAIAAFAADVHAAGPVTYESVDSYKLDGWKLTVSGVVQGDTAASEATYYVYSSNATYDHGGAACVQAVLTAANRPGRFFVVLEPSGAGGLLYSCRLTRRS